MIKKFKITRRKSTKIKESRSITGEQLEKIDELQFFAVLETLWAICNKKSLVVRDIPFTKR